LINQVFSNALTIMESIIVIIGFIIYFLLNGWVRRSNRIARRDYYREYLKSDAWKRKRYVVLKRDNWTCQSCGAKANQVHHKKYARNIGKEPIHWLVSLCTPCHKKIHN
jgi:5-methylcytosine-specific restriction endonuclease McrA